VTQLRAVLASRARPALVDAYCGSGLFGLFLADLAGEVVGLETDGAAVRAARHNAERLGLPACRFVQGSAEGLLDECLAAREADGVCLLLDPPRAGCPPGSWRRIARRRPARSSTYPAIRRFWPGTRGR